MISTPSELIDALDGTGAVATLLDVEPNTVSTWRVRGLPAWAQLKLKTEVEARDIRCEAGLFEPARPRSRCG